MEQTASVLKAISQPTRLRIILLLAETELCTCELGAILGITQPAVSQHMAVLKKAGLVSERKSGTWVYYQLVRTNVDAALQWLNMAIALPRSAIGSSPADWNKLDKLISERQQHCDESKIHCGVSEIHCGVSD